MKGSKAIISVYVESGLEGPWREWDDPGETVSRIIRLRSHGFSFTAASRFLQDVHAVTG